MEFLLKKMSPFLFLLVGTLLSGSLELRIPKIRKDLILLSWTSKKGPEQKTSGQRSAAVIKESYARYVR